MKRSTRNVELQITYTASSESTTLGASPIAGRKRRGVGSSLRVVVVGEVMAAPICSGPVLRVRGRKPGNAPVQL
jgi:hypothetical protein